MRSPTDSTGLVYFPGNPGRVPILPWDAEARLGRDPVGPLVGWIRRTVAGDPIDGHETIVLGLSGGLDSAVAALLAKEALGAERVRCVVVDLGARGHTEQARGAVRLAERFGLRAEELRAPHLLEQQLAAVDGAGSFTYLNVVTRLIHGLVFQVADRSGATVLSTVDRTELLVGRHMEYFYGHVAPLEHLYKSEVAEVGRRLGLDEAWLTHAPGCTDAWSDEEAFGMPTEVLDAILEGLQTDPEGTASLLEAQGVRAEWLATLRARMTHARWRLSSRAY